MSSSETQDTRHSVRMVLIDAAARHVAAETAGRASDAKLFHDAARALCRAYPDVADELVLLGEKIQSAMKSRSLDP